MDSHKKILAYALSQHAMKIEFSNLKGDVSKIVEGECYRMIKEIQDILSNAELDDTECFLKIEAIVSAFEKRGIYTGRHDFG